LPGFRGQRRIRADRPDKLNALDPAMFATLIEAGERLIPRKDLRAVVLHGAGRGFCAGLDMQSFAAMAMGRSDGLLADLVQRTQAPPTRRSAPPSSGATCPFR
jgi:enoyl-CoA hydratase/carnithine racemase